MKIFAGKGAGKTTTDMLNIYEISLTSKPRKRENELQHESEHSGKLFM